jgi:hypothetical protein
MTVPGFQRGTGAGVAGQCQAGVQVMNMNSDNYSDTPDAGVPATEFDIRHLSAEQLARLGVAQIAYVKPVVVNGTPGFAIHAADGTAMAIAGDRDVAIAAIQQHEMFAVSVH